MSCFYCLEPKNLKLCPGCRRARACCEEHLAIHRGSTSGNISSGYNSNASSRASSCGSRSSSRRRNQVAPGVQSRFKSKCFPFKIVKNEAKGLCMVATRDIKPLELILEEYPAVQGPYLKTRPQCLECYKEISKASFHCPGCNFPMCGQSCAEGPLHSQNECAIFQKSNFKVQLSLESEGNEEEKFSPSPEYAAITTIRALMLKEASPKKWESFQLLMDHCQKRLINQPEAVAQHQTFLVDFLKKGLPETFGNLRDYDIHRTFGILDVNNVNLSLSEGRGTGLYLTFARINHSCICNTRALKFKDQRMELRAATKIKQGDEITTQYVKPSNVTQTRQRSLLKKWHFQCSCPRCLDRTELGSLYSALNCTSCSKGTPIPVLPIDPLNPDSDWECLECETVYSAKYAEDVIKELELAMAPPNADEDKVEDVAVRCERILHEFTPRVHPNNRLLIDVQSRLAEAYGSGEKGVGPRLEEMSRPMVQRKMQICNHVLDVMSKIDPGYTAWRGQILWELTKTKVFAAKRDFAAGLAGKDVVEKAQRDEKFLGIYIAYHQSVLLSGSKKDT